MIDLVTRQASERRRKRDRRRRGLLVMSAIAVVLVLAGAVLVTRDDRSNRVTSGPVPIGPAPTTERGPLTEPEGWTPTAASPLSGRARPVTAWTGTELLIWGGDGAFSDGGGGEAGRSDGAAYDPASNTWRPMADSPLPHPGNALGASDYASAWTGRELLMWGGPGPKAAAYDPSKDSWRTIDPGPLGTRNQFASTWTGTELVVAGGVTPVLEEDEPFDGGRQTDAAAYDPTTDSWRKLPDVGMKRSAQAVWTGSEVLLLADDTGGSGHAGMGLALDPDHGGWRRTSPPPLTTFTAPPVWTGREVVAVGAASAGSDDPSASTRKPGTATYDPASDRWTSIDTPSGLEVEQLLMPTAVWSGREVLLLGAPGFGAPEQADVEGAAFDPEAGTWRALPAPGLSGRGGMASAWTGSELIIWGGAYYSGFTSEPQADGARYRPGPGR